MYKIVEVSTETWNNSGVSVLKIHEDLDVNKTLLLLLRISGINKRLNCMNIYHLIVKKQKENMVLKNDRIHKTTNWKV